MKIWKHFMLWVLYYTANFFSTTWLYCRVAVNVTLTSRCWKPFWTYQYGHRNNVTTPAPYYTGLTLQRHCMGNTVAVLTKVNFSVTFKLSYHHRRTTSLYRHPPEGDDLGNGWVGSHSVTLLSDCTVTVQPILHSQFLFHNVTVLPCGC